MYFTDTINNWDTWSEVYHSIPAFSALVKHILQKENLPEAKLENLKPGTNAVFKAGNYVVKIFAPAQSGADQGAEFQTEIFATRRANTLDIASPKLIAEGTIADKYRFDYLIIEYIESVDFHTATASMPSADKYIVGQKLRELTDTMNTPCEAFNENDVYDDNAPSFYEKWKGFSESFKASREAYIRNHPFGSHVFVHGDLCGDNILLTPQNEIILIDFADAVLAPAAYEHALVAAELFKFDKDFMDGYFKDGCDPEDIVSGLLIHGFGDEVISENICKAGSLNSVDDLRKKIQMLYLT